MSWNQGYTPALPCVFTAACPAGIEETWQIQQQQIVSAVEQGAARKAFDLALPDLGPYRCAYSRAGRHIVLGGTKGHLAVMEWQSSHLTCEVQVRFCGCWSIAVGLGTAVGSAMFHMWHTESPGVLVCSRDTDTGRDSNCMVCLAVFMFAASTCCQPHTAA
jgi:hypothetical protein